MPLPDTYCREEMIELTWLDRREQTAVTSHRIRIYYVIQIVAAVVDSQRSLVLTRGDWTLVDDRLESVTMVTG